MSCGGDISAAQVKVERVVECEPLEESVYRPILEDNYYGRRFLMFELTRTQVNELVAAFQRKVRKCYVI